MKELKDYKGTRTAIHCKTEEEWNKITLSRASKSYYIKFNYQVILASEFLTKEVTNNYYFY